MERFYKQHQPLFRHVLHAEWLLLGVALAMTTLASQFSDPAVSSSLLFSLIPLTALATLSIYFPDDDAHGLSRRLVFLFVEIVLITAAFYFGKTNLAMILYLPVIAKACLLLEQRLQLWLVLGFCLLLQVVFYSLKAGIADTVYRPDSPALVLLGLMTCAVILNVPNVAFMVVVIVFVLTLVSEQKLRVKSERLAKEVESLASEIERARIAREIHDVLGHTLTSLKLQLEVARKFETIDHGRSEAARNVAEQLASRSLTDVKIALQCIVDANFNFGQAVTELKRNAEAAGNLQVVTSLEPIDLQARAGLQLFRIAQECMTNTLKHAQASSVKIVTKASDNELVFTFEDDGSGFDTAAHANGFGLKGMQERVNHLGGSLDISDLLPSGSRIVVKVPLDALEQARLQAAVREPG